MKGIKATLALMLAVAFSLLFAVFVYAESTNAGDMHSGTSDRAHTASLSSSAESSAQNTTVKAAATSSVSDYDDGVVGRVLFGVCVSLGVILIGAVSIFVLSKLKHRIG